MRGCKTVALVFAAGQSRRMGTQNKLLMEFDGEVLLHRVVGAALASACDKVVVVLGHQAEQVRKALGEFDVEFVENQNFDEGMASSIRAGVEKAAAIGGQRVLMLLGDMPKISTEVIDRIIGAHDSAQSEDIVIATSSGKRGNPVLWPKKYFDDLCSLSGDTGARQIFKRFGERIVEVEIGEAARFDLDTREAFESIG